MNKAENEITLKINCSIDEFENILKSKNFVLYDNYFLDSIYMVPNSVDIKTEKVRDILSQAVLIRNVNNKDFLIEFKEKNIDKAGNILNQSKTNCRIYSIIEATKLFEKLGYIKLIEIDQICREYSNDKFMISIFDVKGQDVYIEVETNTTYDTIDKLKQKLDNLNLPIDKSNYYIKKAEIELEKLKKELN